MATKKCTIIWCDRCGKKEIVDDCMIHTWCDVKLKCNVPGRAWDGEEVTLCIDCFNKFEKMYRDFMEEESDE